jgi:hypothetical protein
MSPKFGVWAHICGSDLVRDADGTVYVLEDNLRVPSGVSYLLQNRAISKRAFADLFEKQSILPVDDYPDRLRRLLVSLASDDLEGVRYPQVVVLTPGVYNSAYFAHAFLAQQMGVPLVEGADLFVDRSDRVWMRTIDGPKPVDVVYRRIDDQFLDPEVFRPDSRLGVPGLMRAWRAGKVAIANAPGAGVADDKVVYAWAPDFIRYYLDEEPLIPNVPTYRCFYDDELEHVCAHATQMVLKPANESGGYGLTIGSAATPEQLDAAIAAVRADPRNWVAQPILHCRPRRCAASWCLNVTFGRSSCRAASTSRRAASRVALVDGSLVVNSSQGGGSRTPGSSRVRDAARVAEQLYWAARYLERAEGTARIVREHSNVIVDLPLTISPNWDHLLGITGSREGFDEHYEAGDESSIVSFLIADPSNPGSIYSSIVSARDNLRTCRDILPAQAWNAVNDLYLAAGAVRRMACATSPVAIPENVIASTNGCSAS